MYASSEGSGETAQLCRLARPFTAGYLDKYQNPHSCSLVFQSQRENSEREAEQTLCCSEISDIAGPTQKIKGNYYIGPVKPKINAQNCI